MNSDVPNQTIFNWLQQAWMSFNPLFKNNFEYFTWSGIQHEKQLLSKSEYGREVQPIKAVSAHQEDLLSSLKLLCVGILPLNKSTRLTRYPYCPNQIRIILILKRTLMIFNTYCKSQMTGLPVAYSFFVRSEYCYAHYTY